MESVEEKQVRENDQYWQFIGVINMENFMYKYVEEKVWRVLQIVVGIDRFCIYKINRFFWEMYCQVNECGLGDLVMQLFLVMFCGFVRGVVLFLWGNGWC